MKTLLMALLLASSTAFAQGTTKAPLKEEVSSQGIRVGFLTGKLQAELNSPYGKSTVDLDQAFGLSVGYASLPVQNLGWTSNVTYIDIQNVGYSSGLIRIDGNLAWAFTNIFSIKGGLNASKFTSGTGTQDLDAAIGFQAGVGVQITKNFGFDLNYIQMNQSGKINNINVDLKESGLEIGLNGTF